MLNQQPFGRSILTVLVFQLGLFSIPDAFAQTAISKSSTKAPEKEINPNLLRGPYLQIATPHSITVRWRTDALERGVVRYGTNQDSLGNYQENPALTMEHIITIKNLKPSTKYYYSIGSGTNILQGDKDNYFITPPATPAPRKYMIGAFGDCGNNSDNQKGINRQFVKYLGENYMDAWLLLGDNAYESGTDSEYQKNFFEVYQADFLKKFPLFPAPGNHDYREIGTYRGKMQSSRDIAYYHNFSVPVNGEAGGVPSNNPAYYSFDIGNIHFLSLDSYGKEAESLRLYDTLSSQVQWVKKDLEANRNKQWVVAYWHHPPFTMGSHNSDKEQELVKIRQNFIQILERYGVDLVLTGHSHSYERTRLIKGHYGPEASFSSGKHDLSTSSATFDGTKNSCPYIKDSKNNQGTVYVVSGSAGKIDSRTQATFPHDAMVVSNAVDGGALMLEVERNRLDLKWLGADGEVRDKFTMMKDVNRKTTVNLKNGQSATLTASFVGDYEWTGSKEKGASIRVSPRAGKHTYSVRDKYSCVEDVFEVIVNK
jgi:hypothetical protein